MVEMQSMNKSRRKNEKLESKATDMTAIVADTQVKVELDDVL